MALSNEKTAPKFTELNDLINEKIGGVIIFATDDWFAEAENLLKSHEPKFDPNTFTDFGKEMDGWETRRKRIPGHDWCIIQMGVAGKIEGVEVDTAFFTGNFTPRVSIQAAALSERLKPRTGKRMGTCASEDEFNEISKLHSEDWDVVIPRTEMKSGYEATRHSYIASDSSKTYTHLRLNMYPDGGIARLRVYGKSVIEPSKIDFTKQTDLIAMVNGGVCTGFSNAHYGHPRNIIGQGRSVIMADGWETARRLDRPAILEADEHGVLKVPGNEWATFQLGLPGVVEEIEIDTNLFKGNFPDSCKIEGCFSENGEQMEWKILLPPKKMKAHARQFFYKDDIVDIAKVSHIRLTMAPDGGVSRLRLLGMPSPI